MVKEIKSNMTDDKVIIKAVALDPGATNTGVFVFNIVGNSDHFEIEPVEIKTIVNRPEAPDNQSKGVLYAAQAAGLMQGIIEQVIIDHDPNIIFAEFPHGGSKSASAARPLNFCTMMLGILATEYTVIPITPTEVKEITGVNVTDKVGIMSWAINKHPELNWETGNRKNKLNMQNAAGKSYTTSGGNEHMADAIAAAYAGVETEKFVRWWIEVSGQSEGDLLPHFKL